MYKKLTVFFWLASYFCSSSWLYAQITPPVSDIPLVQIENGWVRAVPSQLTLTAAYMQIKNLTERKLTLVGARTPAFAKVEMHQTVFEDNLTRMVPVEKLIISPQEVVMFKPKSLHFMLIDRQQPLTVGDTVTLTLQFEGNKTQTIKLEVKEENGKDSPHSHH